MTALSAVLKPWTALMMMMMMMMMMTMMMRKNISALYGLSLGFCATTAELVLICRPTNIAQMAYPVALWPTRSVKTSFSFVSL